MIKIITRNLLIFTFILCIINLYYDNIKPDYIDPDFQNNFDNFIEKCEKLDINTIRLRNVDSIIYGDLNEDTLGLFIRNKIIINKLCKNTKTTLHIVLYHEYGHALGLKHCEEQYHIMSKQVSSDYIIDRERLKILYLLEDKYFKRLKKL